MSDQALCEAHMGDLHWRGHSLRIRFLPLWLACAREGHFTGDNPIQVRSPTYSGEISQLMYRPSLIALKDRRYLGAFRPLAVAGHVSLFPLLFTPAGKSLSSHRQYFRMLTRYQNSPSRPLIPSYGSWYSSSPLTV